jgi:NitT/TauT family transport system substrate-binding protein
MAIVLQESLRALFYAPYYAALALGAYDQEELEVRFLNAPRPGQAPNAIFQGTVDVVWGGPMRVNQIYDQRANCDLVCFGEAVTRDPFMLIGPTPRPNFRLAVLAAMRIAPVNEVPTPWLCLQDDLRRVGIDPDALARGGGGSMAENAYAFRHKEVDVVQLSQPLAEQLIASRAGHLWYAGADRGPCSYTSFYTRHSILDAKREEMVKLVRALYRTQKWLHRMTPETVAGVIRTYFPSVSVDVLSAAVARYRSLQIWGRNPILPEDGYERLKAALVAGGFARGTPFEIAVDNSIAEQVVAEDPPSL